MGRGRATSRDKVTLALVNPPTLALPQQDNEFILATDASDIAIGTELLQFKNGVEKIISYSSLVLTKTASLLYNKKEITGNS